MSALPTQHLRLRLDRLAELTDAERAIVEQRRDCVDAWRNLCRDFAAAGRKRKEATELFLATRVNPTTGERLSQATLYRWSQRRDSADPTDLLDGRSKSVRSPDSSSKQVSICSPEAWAHFKSLWLTIHRRTVALCWQMTAYEAQQQGWAWPSKKTIERKIKRELPPFKADYFRLGQRQWHRLYGPKLVRNYDQYRAGEHWIGDCHIFDVFCRRSDDDPTIVRPILAAFTDLRTRAVVGWHIGEHENADAILLAANRGFVDWGIPDHQTIDNGKPYRSKAVSGGRPGHLLSKSDEDRLRSCFGALEVTTHFSIPYNPDSKPIERWFATLESQLGATFETYCGGQKDDRFREAHRKSIDHPELCPTVDQLRSFFARYIESYHATPHSGAGMHGLSPAQAFKRFDPIAKKTLPDGAFDVIMMRITAPVKVTCHGVRYLGDHYGAGHPQLQLLQGSEVLLRVHPVHAGSVIVCDLQGKPICEAVNNRRLYTGVTQDDIAAGMKRRKRARDLAKSCLQGGLQPLHQSVTEAAIAARLDAGRKSEQQRAVKTGTHDQPEQTGEGPRNVKPLRSDWAQSMRQFKRANVVSQLAPARPEPDQSFERAVEDMAADPFAGGGQDAWPDLAALDEEL